MSVMARNLPDEKQAEAGVFAVPAFEDKCFLVGRDALPVILADDDQPGAGLVGRESDIFEILPTMPQGIIHEVEEHLLEQGISEDFERTKAVSIKIFPGKVQPMDTQFHADSHVLPGGIVVPTPRIPG